MTSVAGQGVSLAGRYRLDELVASGATGQVWRALDLLMERNVAVKLLRPDAAGDPDARARFRAEARNASRLSPSLPSALSRATRRVKGATATAEMTAAVTAEAMAAAAVPVPPRPHFALCLLA